LILTAFAGPARGAGQAGAIGVGIEYQLSSLGGVSLVHDSAKFHAGAFLGYADGGAVDDTDVKLGGRFYYHVHSTAMSDFGIGGSLGLASVGDRDRHEDENRREIFLEPGAQIRGFFCTNIAISLTAGLSLGMSDADGAAFTGQTLGAASVHYYFF
jgi:hypothetical protein